MSESTTVLISAVASATATGGAGSAAGGSGAASATGWIAGGVSGDRLDWRRSFSDYGRWHGFKNLFDRLEVLE